MTTLLLFGATGFVGGDVLHRLVTDQAASQRAGIVSIVAPVASERKKQQVQTWLQKVGALKGIEMDVPVVAREPAREWYSHAEELSSQVDVVLQLATSDDLELTKAINRGLKKAGTGKQPKVLIHASGVQLIESAPSGEYIEVTKYDDSKPQMIESISPDAAHRSIDVEIDQEFRSGSIRGAIICPALVWGKTQGPVNVVSAMVPDMVRKALHNGKGTCVGTGENQWVHVSVPEVTDLVIALLHKHTGETARGKAATKPWSNFYFVSNNDGRVKMRHIARVIGDTLHKAGRIQHSGDSLLGVPAPAFDASQKGVRVEDAARSAADAEEDARTPLWPTRTNCDCISQRGLDELGWRATRPYTDDEIAKDVHATLEVM